MTTLTHEPATDGQIKQLSRVAEDAAKKAVQKYFEETDVSKEDAQRVHGNPEFAVRVREATILALTELSAEQPDYTQAQSILGTDFITPEEVMEARPGIIYTDEHLASLAETMPSEEDLRWCKNNGYAVTPAPPDPIALLPVRALKAGYFYSETGGWYANEKFASNDKTSRGWLAVRKKPVPNSTSKTWKEQNKLLSAVEEVPNAAEIGWFITTYFAVRDIHLFKDVYVRTSSVDADGCHVRVGYFDARGLYIINYWDGNRGSRIGVASARKF